VSEELAYGSGAGVLVRTQAIKHVGALDPFLFMYHEDLEWGWRFRLAGYRNLLCLTSITYHHYEFARSIKKYFWMERNRWLVLCAHTRLSTLLILLPWLLGLELALVPLAFKGGWIREKILAWRAFLSPKIWKYLRKKRKESALLRTVSDREIVRLWTGTIAYQELPATRFVSLCHHLLAFLWILFRPWIF
jgi:GT2 family glycosyltransferase